MTLKIRKQHQYQHSRVTNGTPTDAEVIVHVLEQRKHFVRVFSCHVGWMDFSENRRPTCNRNGRTMLPQLTNYTEASLAQTAGVSMCCLLGVLLHWDRVLHQLPAGGGMHSVEHCRERQVCWEVEDHMSHLNELGKKLHRGEPATTTHVRNAKVPLTANASRTC